MTLHYAVHARRRRSYSGGMPHPGVPRMPNAPTRSPRWPATGLALLAALPAVLPAALLAGGCATVPAPPSHPATAATPAITATPAGSIQGHATVDDDASRAGLVANAQLALPTAATGSSVFVGTWRDRPATPPGVRLPVV